MNLRKTTKLLRIASLFCMGFFVVGGAAGQTAGKIDGNSARPSKTMEQRVKTSAAKYETLFGEEKLPVENTDPGFAATMKRFTYGEVEQQGKLSDKERVLLTIATLETQGNEDLLEQNIRGALRIGVKPLEIKEAMYQIAPYIGFPKAFDALKAANSVLREEGIRLPLEDQATVDEATRFEKGIAVQKRIFGGDQIDAGYENAPEGQLHIQQYLSAYCFGDTYTRKVLDLKMREMLTMVSIATLGGCEPQLKAHIAANLQVGNDRETIVAALTECIPYIGFPRSLNAMRCVNEVFAAQK